ncbi:Asp23/Gls24 family envelope stress response protein [Desulfitobacterium sp.]|uniref:Asp23/Gls24 family envelope stress response protein n=1 Tax=Desulfitobacterium sp. TaxID=49981 RepID=UPI002CD87E36|nr:Asp23/Gls24 family envelope stress response protein [Desulfitobacterium sp.]HVJ48917.1 Asp23/Gls24 family envelope stress response protein [Desulfitobacterium sp.]
MEEKTTVKNSLGAIRIADEVVEIIAGLAASEVEGVAGMSGGLVGDIAHMLSRGKNLAKGVKVEVGEQEAAIELFIVVEYGVSIPDVALRVQEAVKERIESMTGLRVIETNVHVQGVQFRPPVELKEDENRLK